MDPDRADNLLARFGPNDGPYDPRPPEQSDAQTNQPPATPPAVFWIWLFATAAFIVAYVAVGWWIAHLPYQSNCAQEPTPTWAATIEELWPLPFFSAGIGVAFAKGYRWWFLLLGIGMVVALVAVTVMHIAAFPTDLCPD
jgi:hypothetical protein